MRSARGSSVGFAVRALPSLVAAVLLIVGLFAVHGLVAAPVAMAAPAALPGPVAVVGLPSVTVPVLGPAPSGTASADGAAHEHASLAAVVLPGPAGDADPSWPVCPAPIGHGDAAGPCALGIPGLDVLVDLPAAVRGDTCPSGAPRCIVAPHARGGFAPSLVALSLSRT